MRQKTFYIKRPEKIDKRRILSERIDFLEAVDVLRKKWKVEMIYEYSESQVKLSNSKSFLKDIRKYHSEFAFEERYFNFIKDFVFLDLAVFDYDDGYTFSIQDKISKHHEGFFYIAVDKNIKKKDILNKWSEIESFMHGSKKTKESRKEWKYFYRDRSIYKLAEAGFSVPKIIKYIHIKYKIKMDYDAVSKAESMYRERMKIEESNSLTYKNTPNTTQDLRFEAVMNFPLLED